MVVEHQGHMCELQLSTNDMIATKETAGHRDYDVRRELVQAVRQGDVQLIKETLEWGLSHLGNPEKLSRVLNEQEDKDRKTLLHEAAKGGNALMIHQLLRRKADANLMDACGNTPLHLTMDGGFDQASWCLLDEGNASWSIENKEGSPPLLTGLLMLRQRPKDENAARAVVTLAYKSGFDHVQLVQSRVAEELKKKLHNSTQLVYHSADGAIEKMEVELRQFANPDSTDPQGNVAIIQAARNGHANAVRKLLDLKADVGKHGPQAMDAAISQNKHEVVSELLKAGSTVPTSGDMLLSYTSAFPKGNFNFKYAGLCLGPDGKIYCCPFDAPSVLVIDPDPQAAVKLEFIEGVGDGQRKYFGICVGPDDRMYCAPHHAKNVLVITPNPERGTLNKLSFINGPGLELERKYAGISMGGDGKLYCAPRHASDVLVIDPKGQEGQQISYIKGPETWWAPAKIPGH